MNGAPHWTLAEIVARYRPMFYEQAWWQGETFADRAPVILPAWHVTSSLSWLENDASAVDLAWAYVLDPDDPRFRSFLWTCDYDRYGNRVYVGGVGRYGIDTFQIHRHLADPGACEVVW